MISATVILEHLVKTDGRLEFRVDLGSCCNNKGIAARGRKTILRRRSPMVSRPSLSMSRLSIGMAGCEFRNDLGKLLR